MDARTIRKLVYESTYLEITALVEKKWCEEKSGYSNWKHSEVRRSRREPQHLSYLGVSAYLLQLVRGTARRHAALPQENASGVGLIPPILSPVTVVWTRDIYKAWKCLHHG